MPVFQLDERLVFPPPELADADGLLAVGGDLKPQRLLLAYASGIFPWPTEDFPLLWHSPDPRFVLPTAELHIPKSLRRTLRRGHFRFTLDERFREVITACAGRERPGQRGTWITDEMVEAYHRLYELGFAHSVEVWEGEELVGGLYGVSLGAAFFGESMFAHRPDASKAGFVTLVQQLDRWGITLCDAQVHTSHLERFGARHWPRARYLETLKKALDEPTRRGHWQFDATVSPRVEV
ncbi:MAG: leucyl/phenylalanyl-tRNA--protein transferase [Polyangiaceae bacterium]